MRGTWNGWLVAMLMTSLPAQEDMRALPGDDALPSISGVEAYGNDFRGRTPVLQRSDRHTAKVDRDELYRRRLSLYGGVIETVTDTSNSTPDDPMVIAHRQTQEVEERARLIRAERTNTIAWIGIGFVPLLLGIGLMVKRAGYLSPP